MADFSSEKGHIAPRMPERRQEVRETPEMRAESLAQTEVKEFADTLGEGAEVARERVSESGERAGEEKSVQVGKAQVQTRTQTQIRQLRRDLGKIPNERTMVRQIRTALHREVSQLLSQAHRERYSRNFNPSRLNSLLARIRLLKERIASIASMTYEMIKNLWLKVVKGVV